MIIFVSLKKFRRLWIHLKKTTDKQTKYGGVIDNCDCYHCEKRKDCCKHKNHRTLKTITMLTSFQTPQLQSAVSPLQFVFLCYLLCYLFATV